jgi:hypothetical protein
MKAKPVNLKTLIDNLGKVKAELANLHDDEELLKDAIKKAMKDRTAAEGDLYRCTVSTYSVEAIDYGKVVESLPKSAKMTRLVKKFTSKSERTTLRVSSRIGEQ